MAKMKKISLSSFEVKHYLREPAIITVPIIKMADEQASQTSNPLSTFFTENSLRERRNLRGDIEKRSLYVNEQFESAFREVKEASQL